VGVRSTLLTIATLFAILFFPAAGVAQQDQQQSTTGIRDRDRALAGARDIQNDLQKANFHSGPWYLLTRVQLSDIGFTDEFFVPTADHGAGLAFSVGAPTRLYFVPRRKVVVSAEFVPGYAFFRNTRNGGDGQFNYSARGGVAFLFNRLFLDFYGSRADQLRPRIGDVNALATLKSDELGMSGELKWSSRTSVTFSSRVTDTSYPQDRYQPDFLPLVILDRNERNSRAALIHKTLPRTSFGLAVEEGKFDFDFATFKNGTRTYIAPAIFYDAGRFAWKAEAGPARVDFDADTENDFSGILGVATATARFGRYGLAAGFERDTEFSIFAENNYFIQNRAAASIEYGATRRLKLRASTSHERDTYDTPVNDILRVDNSSFSTVGFRYAWRRLNGGIDVGYYQRDSNFEGDQQDGIRYILHLSFTP
jgi:hypothetical protein